MGPAELSLLQQRLAGTVPAPPPFAAAVASLKADTPAQYTPHALKDVWVGWNNEPKTGEGGRSKICVGFDGELWQR
jgi:hypothetical protein